MSIPIQECPECGFVTPCKCEKRKNPTYGQLLAEAKFDEQTTPAPTPWSAKSEAYWHEQYQLMREKYHRQIGENSQQAERIVQLEAALDAMVEGVARKSDSQQAARIRELEEQLKAKQGESRELYAMLGHIVDWSPELPFYMKDEYKTLFRNALAAARELLSKCKVKEGK